MPEFLGLANQNCSNSPETAGTTTAPYVAALNPGDTAWTCPATGYYTLTARGAGGTASGFGAGSAAACQKTELIRIGEIVTLSIGRASYRSTNVDGGDTTVTFPSGHVMVAGGGKSSGAAGAASGGDLNVAGNVGGTAGASIGGVAPAIGDFPATTTAVSNLADGTGSGSSNNGSTTGNGGGQGIVYVVRGKAPRIL